MKKILGAILVIAIVLGIVLVPSYNNLVGMREDVNNQYAQVQTVIQRRADLIPNLVNTVKGYAKHEQQVLTDVTKARSSVQEAKNPQDLAKANDEMSSALQRLMVVVEAYPDLKANQNFVQLQDELAGTENRIAVERKNYNDIAKQYNTKVKTFPTSIVAGLFRFDPAQYFAADAKAQDAPQVNFD